MPMNAPEKLPNGIIPAAYIGVDGERYRVRVPVNHIHLHRREGPTALCVPHDFTSWHEVNWHLARQAHTAPKGGAYDKHDFTVTWANGETYTGRFDLQSEMEDPHLEQHIQSFLTYVNENITGMFTDEQAEEAEKMMARLDLRQVRPSAAPSDWEVVRDYRAKPSTKDEPGLDLQLYELAKDAA